MTGMVAQTKAKNWRAKVKGLLKAELKRRDLSYAELANRLSVIGIEDNERNISNKIKSRGRLPPCSLFSACGKLSGTKTIHLEWMNNKSLAEQFEEFSAQDRATGSQWSPVK